VSTLRNNRCPRSQKCAEAQMNLLFRVYHYEVIHNWRRIISIEPDTIDFCLSFYPDIIPYCVSHKTSRNQPIWKV